LQIFPPIDARRQHRDRLKLTLVLSDDNMNLRSSVFLAFLAMPLSISMAQAAKQSDLDKLANSKQCNGCDLSQADLSGQDLAGYSLVGANLNGANLVNTNLSGANLTKASIVGTNLAGANLNSTTLHQTTFVYSNLVRVQMQRAKLLQTDFQGANLAEMDLSGSQISKSSFTKANVYGLKLPSSIRANASGFDANGNTFSVSTLKSLSGEGGGSRAVTIEGGVEVYESGGRSRRRRAYSVPDWMSTTQRSTAGGVQFYNSNDPNIRIELW
jgi:uncharacterized protein YjbI with pentapeptide repeats